LFGERVRFCDNLISLSKPLGFLQVAFINSALDIFCHHLVQQTNATLI